MPGGTETLPQPPDIYQRTNINVLILSSITNQDPHIAGFPSVYNGYKVVIRIDLFET